ncbi:uncharacterized protein L201_005535 [Kwoniella dendrophila CBS 6074]|uniref:THUMP domain-containing protein n=1 Tax=Kwoniella dendrophila CBS 6074 TaxID=1295534 RepID=A0AAX4JZH7_9TREE
MTDKAGPSGGEKRKAGGGPSTQKYKFYKYQGQNGGGRGGGGGRGRGRGRGGGGGSSDRPARHVDNDDNGGKPKLNPLGKYRSKPMPEILGAPGICVTTVKNKERAAEAELIDYLERIADELYPDTIESEEIDGEGDDHLDFEAQLKKDLESMDQSKKSKRFQLCYHDIICVIHINVLPPLSPHKLVRHIMEQAESSAKTQLKWCKRIIPINGSSGATVKQLSELAAGIVKDGFTTEDGKALKFAIDTNSRQSEKLDRMRMIHTVAEEVTKLDKGHSVDLKNPDKTILVELYKNTVGIAIVEDYERFKKYNPGSIAYAAAQKQHDESDKTTADIVKDDEDHSNQPIVGNSKTPKHVQRDRRASAIAAQSQPTTTSPQDKEAVSTESGNTEINSNGEEILP